VTRAVRSTSLSTRKSRGKPPRTATPTRVLAKPGRAARPTRPFHWVSPLLRVVDRGGNMGRSLVAAKAIRKGTLVLMMGGHIMSIAQHERLPEPLKCYPTHVSDALLIGRVSLDEPDEPGEFLNHSCDPNCGMQDQLSVVARRHIRAGEVVTIDYAMCMTSPILDLACECGEPGCRGRITGDDWKKRALQERYKGLFVGYIERNIAERGAGRRVSRPVSRRVRRAR
jgi:hypothetical protein